MASSDEQIAFGAPVGAGDTPPSPDQIRKALAESRARDGEGKVMKVLYLDDKGESVGEWASSQVPENPFAGQMNGLQEPPFRLEQLLYLAESHPVHSAAIEQKTVDITGKGWEWVPVDEDAADEEERDALAEWWESLAPDDSDMHEVVSSLWLDVETVGWGLFEAARGPDDIVHRVYHVPGHTVRAHRDGFRLAQIRDARKVWFRRWGAPQVNGQEVRVDARSGSKATIKVPANDMFVVKKPSRRSTWYGIPGYISAVGYITLALAARDDNLFWFANRREPRWAIVLSNLADDPNLEEDLRRAFVVDMRQPYRNIMIPITGPGKVEFNKLSDTKTDGSFAQLAERADKAIMIAHRVPGERLANSQIGPLGGNSTEAASRIYKDGVVQPGQELLNKRLNRFISVEYEKATGKKASWKLQMDDLDIDDDRQNLDMTVIAFHGNLITLGEARARMGWGPLMKKKEQPKPQPTTVQVAPTMVKEDPETGQLLDASTGQPVPTDPATGKPLPVEHPIPPQDAFAPATEEEEPEPEVDEDGNPVPPEMIESEFNDLLFTQLPGSSAQAGNPGTPPIGAGGLKLSRSDASPDLKLLDAHVRDLYRTTKASHEDLTALVDGLREAVAERDAESGS